MAGNIYESWAWKIINDLAFSPIPAIHAMSGGKGVTWEDVCRELDKQKDALVDAAHADGVREERERWTRSLPKVAPQPTQGCGCVMAEGNCQTCPRNDNQ